MNFRNFEIIFYIFFTGKVGQIHAVQWSTKCIWPRRFEEVYAHVEIAKRERK